MGQGGSEAGKNLWGHPKPGLSYLQGHGSACEISVGSQEGTVPFSTGWPEIQRLKNISVGTEESWGNGRLDPTLLILF